MIRAAEGAGLGIYAADDGLRHGLAGMRADSG